jgi:hypothetical protein
LPLEGFAAVAVDLRLLVFGGYYLQFIDIDVRIAVQSGDEFPRTEFQRRHVIAAVVDRRAVGVVASEAVRVSVATQADTGRSGPSKLSTGTFQPSG